MSGLVQRGQQVALAEVDALRDAVALGVAAGQCERKEREADGPREATPALQQINREAV